MFACTSPIKNKMKENIRVSCRPLQHLRKANPPRQFPHCYLLPFLFERWLNQSLETKHNWQK
jgi:hypothetical protein